MEPTVEVIYTREKDGVKVVAQVTKSEVVLQEATENTDAVTKAVADYKIIGTHNGEVVSEEVGPGYRQTANRARKVFQEIYDERVRPELEAKKAKEAEEKEAKRLAREQAKAEKEAEKERLRVEREAKKAEKEAKRARKKQEREEAKAQKEAEKAAKAAAKQAEAEAAE